MKENCPPGVTGLWFSAWYAGRLGSAQRAQLGVEGLWVCAPLAVCTRVVVSQPMILACYSGHPKMELALFICRIMALICHSRVAVGPLWRCPLPPWIWLAWQVNPVLTLGHSPLQPLLAVGILVGAEAKFSPLLSTASSAVNQPVI